MSDQTPAKLPWYRLAILEFLDEDHGYLASRIGERVWKSMPPRTRSQVAVQHLRLMERDGLVRRLDNEKPPAWCRTAAGTAALS